MTSPAGATPWRELWGTLKHLAFILRHQGAFEEVLESLKAGPGRRVGERLGGGRGASQQEDLLDLPTREMMKLYEKVERGRVKRSGCVPATGSPEAKSARMGDALPVGQKGRGVKDASRLRSVCKCGWGSSDLGN